MVETFENDQVPVPALLYSEGYESRLCGSVDSTSDCFVHETRGGAVLHNEVMKIFFAPVRLFHARYKPKGMDSCFGNFPLQYKRSDNWDGNPTLRRDSRTCYSAPSKPSARLRRPRSYPVGHSFLRKCEEKGCFSSCYVST